MIAGWGEDDVLRLLQDPGIVRSRAKIQATIGNARAYLEIEGRQGFAPFLWDFVGGAPIQNRATGRGDVPTESPESRAMSKALKAARLPLLRPGDHLCLHAGDRPGQ